MNLLQLRTIVREALHAGNDATSYVPPDLFWPDLAINYHINEAYRHIQQVIRRSSKNYFTRFIKSTDPVLYINNQRFDPASLRMTLGVGTYPLPPGFVRMRMIRDLRVDKQARFRFVEVGKEEFRQVYNDMFPVSDGSFLCDIFNGTQLVIRPLPSEAFDVEYIFEELPEQLSDYSVGTVSIAVGSNTATFAGALMTKFAVGDEIVFNVPIGAPGGLVNMSLDGYKVLSVLGNDVTISAPYAGDNNLAAVAYVLSKVPRIPIQHHDILASRAVMMNLAKGKNPHTDAIGVWKEIYGDQLAALIADVEITQTSDIETSEAFLEDE